MYYWGGNGTDIESPLHHIEGRESVRVGCEHMYAHVRGAHGRRNRFDAAL